MTTEDKPKWKRLGEKTVYHGRTHLIEYDAELPNGELTKYEVQYSAGGAAATLVKTPQNEIIVTHQYRFPLDEWIYDLPGGGKKKDETFEEAAIRECEEEVGIKPRSIKQLAKFYSNPGRANWPAYVYFCDDYEDTGAVDASDPSEQVELVRIPVAEFKKLVDAQEIVDPMLLIAWHTACSQGYISV
jgi:8-oxo-dGTP pyrophosphatase MutT (NUDIX family)